MNLVAVRSEADVQTVSSLAQEIWNEHYPAIISSAQIEYTLNNFQSITAICEQISKGCQYFLITVNTDQLGYISLLPDNVAESLFISKFYVLKKARNQGLGRKVMAQIERIAQEQQLRQLRLTVNKFNHTAIIAYQKMGFAIVDSLVTDIGGSFVMDDYKMLKSLAEA